VSASYIRGQAPRFQSCQRASFQLPKYPGICDFGTCEILSFFQEWSKVFGPHTTTLGYFHRSNRYSINTILATETETENPFKQNDTLDVNVNTRFTMSLSSAASLRTFAGSLDGYVSAVR